MKKAIALLLILVSVTSGCAAFLPAQAEPKTITVPNDYPTIQAAIGNASQGDTVFVKTGTYYETLVITKSLTIVGEGKEKTVVDAKNATENIIYINANNVCIEGFTITHNKGFPTSVTEPDGIRAEYLSSGLSIRNNTINSIQYGNGITLQHGSGNTIEANHIMTCGGFGIFVDGGSENSIRNNVVVGNGFGTLITDGSHNNTIFGNVFANSAYNHGLQLDNDCSSNTVVGNTFANNRYGLALEPPSSNIFYHNNFLNNTFQVLLFGGKDSWVGLVNSWDNGTEGNFWSDYVASELDHSGVGSLPYSIRANWDSQVVYLDNYPLIFPFGTLPDEIPEFSPQNVLPLFIVTTLLAAVGCLIERKR